MGKEIQTNAEAAAAQEQLAMVRQQAFKVKRMLDKACAAPRNLRRIALAGVSHGAFVAKWSSKPSAARSRR